MRASVMIVGGAAKVAEVRCSTHGVFDYKTANCPGCLNDGRRRYEELVVEIDGEVASARQAARLFKKDAAPPPISAGALTALRHEDPAVADSVLVELEHEQRAFVAQQHQRDLIVAALAALTTTHGKTHRLGSGGSTYQGRLLGALNIGAKRYARLQQGFLDGGEVVCVPWIDAFAEHVGRDVVVQWLQTSGAGPFRISARDGWNLAARSIDEAT
jgi:hypothetical protein